MSVDRSLKMRNALSRHRNVLTRDERMKILVEDERFDEAKDSPFGLPKVAHRKIHAAKKEKKEEAVTIEEAAAAETETPAES